MRAKATSARFSTAPLSGRLSQLSTAYGGTPCARRRRRPSTIQPMVLRGFAGFARSCAMSALASVELVLRVEAVALLGDRERDDARVARREARERRVGVRRAHQQLANRADDARARRGAELHQRVQALLRRQRIAQAGALERQRGDRPALVGVQQRVDVVRLVRAMKRARADVHDAEARGAAVVGGQDRARTNGMQARLGEARRTHQDLAI